MALVRFATGTRTSLSRPPELVEAVEQTLVFHRVTGVRVLEDFRLPKGSLTARLRSMIVRTEGLAGTEARWPLIDARFTERIAAELSDVRSHARRAARGSKRPVARAFLETCIFLAMAAYELAEGRALAQDVSDFALALFHILVSLVGDLEIPSLEETVTVWRRQRDLLRTFSAE